MYIYVLRRDVLFIINIMPTIYLHSTVYISIAYVMDLMLMH